MREALRSIELLGLINTRTFLASTKASARRNIVAVYIRRQKIKKDVELTRQFHGKEAIRVISCTETLRTLPVWGSFFVKLEIESTINCRDVLRELIITSGNRLSLKVWFLLAVYTGDRFNRNSTEEEELIIQTRLISMQHGSEKEVLKAYQQWMNAEQGI